MVPGEMETEGEESIADIAAGLMGQGATTAEDELHMPHCEACAVSSSSAVVAPWLHIVSIL